MRLIQDVFVLKDLSIHHCFDSNAMVSVSLYSFFLQLYCFNHFNEDRQTGSREWKGQPGLMSPILTARELTLSPGPAPINRRLPRRHPAQGSHFFGLTKFHDISMIFPGFF